MVHNIKPDNLSYIWRIVTFKLLLHIIAEPKGLYEARIQVGTDIWRVFCFFDRGKLVILLNGFQKKIQKTPKNEIDKAKRLMREYYDSKK
ncbi:MAG: type II toxin-antitoxin system RelE/ParE family toxin [Bacteroidota bacterium]